MNTLSWEHYTEKQRRAALRVLDTLDQIDGRLEAHYAGKRKHRRVACRRLARLVFCDLNRPIDDLDAAPSCQVWVRAVSQSGLSFVSPFAIDRPGMMIGLDLAGNGATAWFVAEVVRSRKVPDEDFWEHGARFLSRAAAS